MFGYIQPEIPYMYVKDGVLYKALYCGLCKSIGGSCGQTARMGLSYDVTFLSAILHNIKNCDVKIEQKHCVLHPVTKRPIAQDDEITRACACLNTLLTYYKLTDDIQDENKGKLGRSFFRGGYKKAEKLHAELAQIIRGHLAEQEKLEKEKCASPDMAADASANMLADVSDAFLEEYKNEFTHNLFYGIGKWVYLIDALDDYDKDRKKGNYNPFYAAYGAETRAEMLEKNGEEVNFIFGSIFAGNAENLSKIRFYFNHDLTDNIILRGLPAVTKRVMCGCKGIRTKPEKIKLR